MLIISDLYTCTTSETSFVEYTDLFREEENPLTAALIFFFFFFFVEVLRPSQSNGVKLSAVNLPNHTFTGQA